MTLLLAVDDEPSTLMMIEELLAGEHELAKASDGVPAHDPAGALQVPPARRGTAPGGDAGPPLPAQPGVAMQLAFSSLEYKDTGNMVTASVTLPKGSQ